MTRSRALALAASLLISACGGSEPSGPTVTATLSGVVSAAAGPAIEGASVQVGSATATTGADGRFLLQNLPVGSVTVVTTAPGFDARTETVSLAAGTNAHDVLLTPTPTATLAGVVTAGSGAAIAGASVKVGSSTATSGADGSFQLENLPVGNATVVTSATGFDPRTESVSLAAGANAHDIVLTAIPIATVSGVVSSTTGAPIAGASVSIGTANVTAGADGRFEIQVRAGTVLIGANAPGFAPQSEPVTLVEGANTRDIVLPPAGTWGFRAPLIEPNSELALAELNGKLYMLGGYPATRVTSRAVQVYDIAGNSWTLGPQLPQQNNHGMATSVNGKIYLIGGQTQADDPPGSNSYVNTVYELDPARGTWVAKATMPTARSSGVAVVHDGKIYVAGGRPPREGDFAVYDPATDRWEERASMPTARSGIAAAILDGRIFIFGGEAPSETFSQVEAYDPRTNKWSVYARMPTARHGLGAVAVGKSIYVIAGGPTPGASASEANEAFMP